MSDFPSTGRLIGVDHGTARVGLAVCDVEQRVASPLDTYRRRDPVQDTRYFIQLATEYGAVGWVIGLPMHMSGAEGGQAKGCREFGAGLSAATSLPVVYHDERYTSAVADESMALARLTPQQRKDRRDRVAAALILQGFLDATLQAS